MSKIVAMYEEDLIKIKKSILHMRSNIVLHEVTLLCKETKHVFSTYSFKIKIVRKEGKLFFVDINDISEKLSIIEKLVLSVMENEVLSDNIKMCVIKSFMDYINNLFLHIGNLSECNNKRKKILGHILSKILLYMEKDKSISSIYTKTYLQNFVEKYA